MKKNSSSLSLHPHFLDMLFAFKGKALPIFKDVLGLHHVDHIAITHINDDYQLTTLSSTPSLEYNLFSSSLWHHDLTYNFQWVNLCLQDSWTHLYQAPHYDDLYYHKQIKHDFPLGISLACKNLSGWFIYSLASHKACQHTKTLFTTEYEKFYQMGNYCSNLLLPLFSRE